MKHFHEAGHHVTGTNHTLANLSSKYWIVAVREEIRDWEKACNECRTRKLKAADQIMAPLLDVRVRHPLRAFAHVSFRFCFCLNKSVGWVGKAWASSISGRMSGPLVYLEFKLASLASTVEAIIANNWLGTCRLVFVAGESLSWRWVIKFYLAAQYESEMLMNFIVVWSVKANTKNIWFYLT